MKKVALLNGPNLNLLGDREPGLYGTQTLSEIEKNLAKKAKTMGISFSAFQSNCEGDLVEEIHRLRGNCDLVIINAAALTHTSIAIRDALLAVKLPLIEVHLSNVFKREEFRHHSYLSDIAIGVISGFGPKSYELALEAARDYLNLSAPKESGRK